jgi:GH18 family chitinase
MLGMMSISYAEKYTCKTTVVIYESYTSNVIKKYEEKINIYTNNKGIIIYYPNGTRVDAGWETYKRDFAMSQLDDIYWEKISPKKYNYLSIDSDDGSIRSDGICIEY